MSDKKDKAKQAAESDLAEFGPVMDVEALAPESDAAPSTQRDMRDKVMNPTKAGYFEPRASHVATGLTLDDSARNQKNKDSIWKDWHQDQYGVDIKRYQAGYRAYLVPYRETLRAEGRVKDLSVAGAMLTPDELKAKQPEAAKRFHALSNDGQEENHFNDWSKSEGDMITSIKQFGGLQHSLFSALKSYDRIQDRLKERRVQAKKDGATAEVRKIEESAETLVRITDVTTEAVSWLSETEVLLGNGLALNESAEGVSPGDISSLPQSGNPDWGHSSVDDPSGSDRKVSRGRQVAGAAYDGAGEYQAKVASIGNYVKTTIQKGGGQLDLNLKNLFMAAEGNASKYLALNADIARFTQNVSELQMSQEAADIMAVKENLTGTTMQYNATRQSVKANRSLARRQAKAYADTMKGDDTAVLAMYAAEAFQELAAFGRLADMQRRSMVDPQWHAIHRWLDNEPPEHFRLNPTENLDARHLAQNIAEVGQQKQHLQTHLGDWERKADAWNSFFAMPLTPGGR